MKVYLHLGVHKTASTLIQRSIQISDTEKHTIYPVVRDSHKILSNHLRRYLNGNTSKKTIQSIVGDIKDDAKKKNCKTLLISDENLIGDPASVWVKKKASSVFYPNFKNRITLLKDLFNEDIKIILYTRKQETLFRSLYLDGLKYFRYAITLDEFIQYCLEADFRFDDLIDSLDNIDLTLVPYETIKKGTKEFIENFWRCIGHPTCGKVPNSLKHNSAITDLHANISLNLAKMNLTNQQKIHYRKWLSKMPKLPKIDSNIVLSQERLAMIRQRYKDDITYG